MFETDILIIGSGPAGVQAADSALRSGKKVMVLDGGKTAPSFLSTLSDRNFEDVRRIDSNQHRIFLGEDFSGIPVRGEAGGVLLGGNRSFVTAETDRTLPLKSNAQVIRSLAVGGLGAAWGAECAYLEEKECGLMGLPKDLHQFEDDTAANIGISGPLGKPHMQPPVQPDLHAQLILERAKKAESTGFEVEQSCIAAKNFGLTDMEYFVDAARTVYRPQYTLEALKKEGVVHTAGFIAERISKIDGGTSVTCHAVDGGAERIIRARAVIVAAGAVESARLMLRSMNKIASPAPFLAKDHVFVVCLHPSTLGQAGPKKRTSLCQVVMRDLIERDGMEQSFTQLYSYRSFQLFRMLSGIPLPMPSAMKFLSLLTPSIVIADVRFPVWQEQGSTLQLQSDGTLSIDITRSKEELRARAISLSRVRKALRSLGLLPLKTMTLPIGSASHYAGTIPNSQSDDSPITTTDTGEVRGMPRVFVADASVFTALTAKPHTFTMMANARRIAGFACERATL